jgi:hypothetical protein
LRTGVETVILALAVLYAWSMTAWRAELARAGPAAGARGACWASARVDHRHGTFLGGILHTLPVLISDYRTALVVAVIVIAFELLSLALIRWRFFHTGFLGSFVSIALGGAIIAAISAGLGGAAG